ncbi:ABC transporter substrate-binding protein [Arenibacter latericius]|uniref:ABC transporter substrate-binding protein n=1 Tax=Arenibacter latericius TaxID=86104 RepID=UPI00047B2A2D|nr:ABC transporter substrate-binding protein [Arenibacter latericius]
MKKIIYILIVLIMWSCKQDKKERLSSEVTATPTPMEYAKGFTMEKLANGLTIIKITSPWPNAEATFTYALVPKDLLPVISLDRDAYQAIIPVPVENIVVTSTTHVPALEALGQEDKLIGFPDTKYISSEITRERIDAEKVKDLGKNEALNTEMVIDLNPDLVVGFGINNENKAYETIQRAGIPVVYNGEWTEETPLGKAEWIKFFAPFFLKEAKADSIFSDIAKSYNQTKQLAEQAKSRPTVLSGALYKDVWYLPGGKSWGAQFLEDANTNYLWKDSKETGSLSLSLESVLEKGQEADFWISPSQFTSYKGMIESNRHYSQFSPFKNKKIYTYANTKGATEGMLYFELAPNRPDLVLKDLIQIFHPELLMEHNPVFFKPLD